MEWTVGAVIVMIAALPIVAAGIVVAALNRGEKRTYRDDYFITPFELGVPFEKVDFETDDGVVLRGWWMPRPGSRVVVGTSGLNGRKSDLVGIGTALWKNGNSVLLFDCRGRGESGTARRSPGYREREDIAAAVRYAAGRVRNPRLGLIGYSMGAVIALYEAARNGSVAAVAVDSPFADLKDLVAGRLRKRRLPARPIVALADALNRLFFGYRLGDLRPVEWVGRLDGRPLLIIHGTGDSIIPADHGRRLYESAREPRELWLSEGIDHCGTYFDDRRVYMERVAGFFRKALER